jgi:hypothetical protein
MELIRTLSKIVGRTQTFGGGGDVTADETWVFQNDSETKTSDTPVSDTIKKMQMSNLKIESIIISSDMKGVIHYEYVYSKQSTKHSSFKFWNIYGSAFVKKRRERFFGQTSGFCIMTMHLPTQHSFCIT